MFKAYKPRSVETEWDEPEEHTLDTPSSEETIGDIKQYFARISKSLSEDTNKKISDIIAVSENYYEFDEEGWDELLEELRGMFFEFEGGDRDQVYDKEVELAEHLQELVKRAQQLKPRVH